MTAGVITKLGEFSSQTGIFKDNNSRDISPQNMRDFAASFALAQRQVRPTSVLSLKVPNVKFLAGQAFADQGDDVLLNLAVDLEKVANTAWGAGQMAGGLVGGTIPPTTGQLRYAFLMRNDAGQVDGCFDIDPQGANIPAGYTSARLIGYVQYSSAGSPESVWPVLEPWSTLVAFARWTGVAAGSGVLTLDRTFNITKVDNLASAVLSVELATNDFGFADIDISADCIWALDIDTQLTGEVSEIVVSARGTFPAASTMQMNRRDSTGASAGNNWVGKEVTLSAWLPRKPRTFT